MGYGGLVGLMFHVESEQRLFMLIGAGGLAEMNDGQ